MSFRKLAKPGRTVAPTVPSITLAPASHSSTYLALNRAAQMALAGGVKYIHFEYDDEKALLRIVASSPDDPASYALSGHGRVSVTGMLRDLGLRVTEATCIPVQPVSRLAIQADLSVLTTASVTPIRKAAS